MTNVCLLDQFISSVYKVLIYTCQHVHNVHKQNKARD